MRTQHIWLQDFLPYPYAYYRQYYTVAPTAVNMSTPHKAVRVEYYKQYAL